MAAGSSRRLHPLTKEIPKTLLKLGEVTILERILENCRAAGLTHIDLVTGHGHPAVEEFVARYHADHPEVDLNLIYNDQYDSAGNVVSFQYAKPIFDEDFILINSDTVFHADILKRLIESPHGNVMVVDDLKDLGEEEMKVLVDNDENITHIHKSLNPADSHGEYIGVLKLSAAIKDQLLDSIDRTVAEDSSVYYEDALQRLITDHGVKIKRLSTDGLPAMEIDTHEDLAAAGRLAETL
jgi:choline kinase